MARLLLLVPTATYRAQAFLAAALRLGVEVTVASEEASALAAMNPHGLLTLDFGNVEHAVQQALAFHAREPIAAVVGVDDQVTETAAAIGQALGLVHNPIESVRAARDKSLMRERFRQAGVPSPRFVLLPLDEDPTLAAGRLRYPCVVKPLILSGSRGVMRADDPEGFIGAVRRLATILDDAEPDSAAGGRRQFLVEELVPGPEVALEGLLRRGRLHVLALFDKPDPLEGPFFEETIYVTPSRLGSRAQAAIRAGVDHAVRALGLREGPIHAELRLGPAGPIVIEVHARSIGGRCSAVLRFGTGISLEEVILRHALDPDFEPPAREDRAAGVMMIPIPRAGILRRVAGVEAAARVSGIEDVLITMHPGQRLIPLPEGARYLGFLFARAPTPQDVESALREAHAQLDVQCE